MKNSPASREPAGRAVARRADDAYCTAILGGGATTPQRGRRSSQAARDFFTGSERSPLRQVPWLALALLATLAPAGAQGGGRGRGRGQPPPPPPELAPALPPKNLPPIYLPGFEPQKPGGQNKGKNKGKGKPPAGAQPKPGAAAPKDAKPADPMKAADEVTAEADHRSQQEELQQALLAEHFRICDLDGNGWLSLREGEVTLSLDRAEYRRADENQDGRLDAAEFAREQDLLLTRLGALPAARATLSAPQPRVPEPARAPEGAPLEPALPGTDESGAQPAPGELGAIRVTPGDILRHYDRDDSQGIGSEELQTFLGEIGLTLSHELVLSQMDPNESGQLEANELVALAWLASRNPPEALSSANDEPGPATESAAEPTEPAAVAETVSERASDDSTLPLHPPVAEAPLAEAPLAVASPPARSTAGLTHFGRLDADGDGFIDEADLRKLQSPARVEVRLKAVLSALDQNGDGRLAEAEFRATMNDEPR